MPTRPGLSHTNWALAQINRNGPWPYKQTVLQPNERTGPRPSESIKPDMAKAHVTSMAQSGHTRIYTSGTSEVCSRMVPRSTKTIHICDKRLSCRSLPDKGPTLRTIAICEILGSPNISTAYKRKPRFTFSRYEFHTHPNTLTFL